jgi:hypothetical protein
MGAAFQGLWHGIKKSRISRCGFFVRCEKELLRSRSSSRLSGISSRSLYFLGSFFLFLGRLLLVFFRLFLLHFSSRSGSSRSSSRLSGISSRSLYFLGSFFLFLGRLLLVFFRLFLLHFSSRSSSRSGSSRSSSRLSSRLGGISSEHNCGEGNSYEGGNDGGENFFHLYYLLRELFDYVTADSVPNRRPNYNML